MTNFRFLFAVLKTLQSVKLLYVSDGLNSREPNKTAFAIQSEENTFCPKLSPPFRHPINLENIKSLRKKHRGPLITLTGLQITLYIDKTYIETLGQIRLQRLK